MQCFIAKIGGVDVLQFGNSTLSGTNKKEDRADVKKGKNKAIDLGRAKQTLSITVKIQDKQSFTQIYNIATKDRFTSMVDKFLGELKVYVDSFKIVHSDNDFGTTTINLTFSIIEEFKGSPDYSGEMTRISQNILKTMEVENDYKSNIPTEIFQGVSVIDDFNDKLNDFTQNVGKYMSTPTNFLQILRDIVNTKNNIMAFMRNPKAFLSATVPLFREITQIVDEFNNFNISPRSPMFKTNPINLPIYPAQTKTVNDSVGFETEIMHDKNLNSLQFNKIATAIEVTELVENIYYYPQSDEADTTKGLQKGVDLSFARIVGDIDTSMQFKTNVILNEVDEDTSSKEEELLEQARNRGFKTYLKSTSNITNNTRITPKERVLALQENILKRLGIIGQIQAVGNISPNNLKSARYIDTEYYKTIVHKYIKNTLINNTLVIEVDEPRPLIRIVFEIYGTLDYYEDIVKLNRITQFDNFVGRLEIFI